MKEPSFVTYILLTVMSSHPEVDTKNTQPEYCLANDDSPYTLYGMKSTYGAVRGKSAPVVVDHCDLVGVWALIRYGASFPDYWLGQLVDLKEQVLKNQQQSKGELCQADFINLVNWEYKYARTYVSRLTDEGKLDMITLAKSWKNKYPELFNNPLVKYKTFTHGTDSRTQLSARNFLASLEHFKSYNATVNEKLIEPEKECDNWRQWVQQSHEYKKYAEGPEISSVISRVSLRLGFNKTLSFEQIRIIYNACAYDRAIFPLNVPAWCAAFTKKDLKILEHLDDVFMYYYAGNGNPYHSVLSCPLIRDFFLALRNVTETGSSNYKQITLHFGGALTMTAFIAGFQIVHKHNNLTSWDEKNPNLWSSHVVPFSGNFAALMYYCPESKETKVVMYINDNLITVEGCDKGACSPTVVRATFGTSVPYKTKTCHKEVCGPTGNEKGGRGATKLTMSKVNGLLTALVCAISRQSI